MMEPVRKFLLGEANEGGLKVISLVLAWGVLGRQQHVCRVVQAEVKQVLERYEATAVTRQYLLCEWRQRCRRNPPREEVTD